MPLITAASLAGVGAVALAISFIANGSGGGPPRLSSTESSHPGTPAGRATGGSTSAGSTAATGAPGGATRTCVYTAAGSAARQVSLPPTRTNPAAVYTAVLRTNRGDIVIKLRNSQAPCTVNSFVHLAEAGFWNGSQCHRLTTQGGLYVLQCGDPQATAAATLTCAQGTGSPGTGGPGYEFNDENLAGATYTAGTVAMANAGPNTNGSQFFLVYKDSTLEPQYSPFGMITSGLNILREVANAGVSCTYNDGAPGDGAPKEKVIIDSVTISRA